MRISDCSSDVFSSDLRSVRSPPLRTAFHSSSTGRRTAFPSMIVGARLADGLPTALKRLKLSNGCCKTVGSYIEMFVLTSSSGRSDEHTTELQSLMRTSYAVFCLKQIKNSNRLK